MYDAVHVLVQALTMLDRSTRLRLVNLTCDGDQAWAFGSSLYNYLNLVGQNNQNLGFKICCFLLLHALPFWHVVNIPLRPFCTPFFLLVGYANT